MYANLCLRLRPEIKCKIRRGCWHLIYPFAAQPNYLQLKTTCKILSCICCCCSSVQCSIYFTPHEWITELIRLLRLVHIENFKTHKKLSYSDIIQQVLSPPLHTSNASNHIIKLKNYIIRRAAHCIHTRRIMLADKFLWIISGRKVLCRQTHRATAATCATCQ